MRSMFQAEETHLVSIFTTLGSRARAVLGRTAHITLGKISMSGVSGRGQGKTTVGLTSDDAPGLVNTASVCTGSIRWFIVQWWAVNLKAVARD